MEMGVVTVTVTAVHSFGLDVEVDGRTGFIPPIELGWTDEKPEDFHVGERVRALIYATTEGRFYASIRQASPGDDPWADPSRFGARLPRELPQTTRQDGRGPEDAA